MDTPRVDHRTDRSSCARCAESSGQACCVTLEPGADSTESVGSALADSPSGQTLCLCPGTYRFTRELGIDHANVTVKGLGATPDAVGWGFCVATVRRQQHGSDGRRLDDPNLWVKNTRATASWLRAPARDLSQFKVGCGSVTVIGAYAVYLKSEDVLK